MNRWTFETLEVCESLGLIPLVSPAELQEDSSILFHSGYQRLDTLAVIEGEGFKTFGEAMQNSCEMIDKVLEKNRIIE